MKTPILQNHDNHLFPIWQHQTMKTKVFATCAALFMSAGIVFAATNDLTALLQKGLFEEEANHNLAAAIRNYQTAIDGFDQDRQLAATAVFRLGECLRKQGKTNEAGIQYARVLREFPDQTNLVKLCSDYLGGAKTSTLVATSDAQTAATSAEDEEVRKIREMIRNSPDLINAPISGVTPLQSAVQSGNITAAELLLANGANGNGTGGASTIVEAPLSLAAVSGNKAMIELLLAKGADVNQADKRDNGKTPLFNAVEKGYKAAAEVLIAHKSEINARDSYGRTPLHYAASSGYSAIAEMLLADGAEVNAADTTGATPLFAAVQNNHPDMVQLLLSNKAEINFTNAAGETPLFLAVKNNVAEMVPLLLSNKAAVNARDKSGYTPLHWAVRNNYPDLVKLLLSNKANVNAATDIGITPLLFAVARSGVDANGNSYGPYIMTPQGIAARFRDEGSFTTNLVKMLLDNGADPQAHIKEGRGSWGPIVPGIHALDLAIEFDHSDIMELLLAGHADPNASHTNSTGHVFTPLLWVLNQGGDKAKNLKILLDHGADPNVNDAEGNTPLLMVVNGGLVSAELRLNLVKQLLEHHADPNKPNNQGSPPLAYEGQEGEMRAALIKAGANEDYQRLGGIFLAQKGTGSIGQPVFRKETATNSANHYTLLEVVAETWRNNSPAPTVDFPDFAHLVINRLKPGGGKEEIAVNLVEIFTNGDCSKDVPMEWGDVVQIPQLDHLLNEMQMPGSSLMPAYIKTLTNCLERQVQIIVKGQTTKLKLLPAIASQIRPWTPPTPPVPGMPAHSGESPGVITNKATPETSPPEKTLYTFLLSEVVQQANVLLLSSDLSRVKVIRHGVEMSYNLDELAAGLSFGGGGGGGGRGGLASNNTTPDLWLRDGDIIEIPDRDPNAPAAK
jgi:ankyrin repeat protein